MTSRATTTAHYSNHQIMEEEEEEGDEETHPSPHPTNNSMSKLVPFVKKLYSITQYVSNEIASWSSDGMQFDILDLDAFADTLHAHYKSSAKTFSRQLFYYGFTTVSCREGGGDGQTKGTYSIRHANLQRDAPWKLMDIRRRSVLHGTWSSSSDPSTAAAATAVDVNCRNPSTNLVAMEQKLTQLQHIQQELKDKVDTIWFLLNQVEGVEEEKKRLRSFEDFKLPSLIEEDIDVNMSAWRLEENEGGLTFPLLSLSRESSLLDLRQPMEQESWVASSTFEYAKHHVATQDVFQSKLA